MNQSDTIMKIDENKSCVLPRLGIYDKFLMKLDSIGYKFSERELKKKIAKNYTLAKGFVSAGVKPGNNILVGLHTKTMDDIIDFCKKYNIEASVIYNKAPILISMSKLAYPDKEIDIKSKFIMGLISTIVICISIGFVSGIIQAVYHWTVFILK